MMERNYLYLVAIYLLRISVVCDRLLIDNNVNGILAAFGDFDADKLTDIFLISEDRRSFEIAKTYQNEPLVRLPPQRPTSAYMSPSNFIQYEWSCTLKGAKEEVIHALIPGDFNGNSYMDVVVVTKGSNLPYSFYLVTGNRTHLDCNKLQAPIDKMMSEPLVFDYDGDMIADLLALDANNQRTVWLGRRDGVFNKEPFPGKEPFMDPNSNSFIDINNDTIADVFVTGKKSMEYWFASPNITEAPILVPYFPGHEESDCSQSSFIDIDGDGLIEHIMLICKKQDCKIVAWNTSNWVVIADNFTDIDNSSAVLKFATDIESGGLNFVPKLRHADVDGDGFIDLLSLMTNQDKTQSKVIQVVILKNIATTSNVFGRTFKPTWKVKQNIGQEFEPIQAAFFDLYEDGKVDVIVASRNPSASKVVLTAHINDQMIDACFLKVLVTSGLCYNDCPRNEATDLSPAYGTNQPGPFVCYEITSAVGKRIKGCAGQMYQSAHFALQMPYSIFGLGQQPNYVDKLTVSIPSNFNDSKLRHQQWSQIVPDAQVVLIPNPPNEPSKWKYKLFLTPSDIVLSTLITLASLCCILVLIICILHRKEILEDLAEHEEYKRHWPESR